MGQAVLPGLKEVVNFQHTNACIYTDNPDKKHVLQAVTTAALIWKIDSAGKLSNLYSKVSKD